MSIFSCKCSILAPTAKGFASIERFISLIILKVSLAEWPIARIILSQKISFSWPLLVAIIDLTLLSLRLILLKQVPNNTLPPSALISSLIFLIVGFNLSVPMWGFALYIMSLGAPWLTNSSNNFLTLLSLVPVVNLPSEKAPAPPSPNCTLELVFNLPPFQNVSTSFVLVSMSIPLSIKVTLAPDLASIKLANNPAGPAPTTIVLLLLFLQIGCSYL